MLITHTDIDKDIKLNTLKCDKNFSCLRNKHFIFCPVESCVNKKVLFVKSSFSLDCNYKILFGNSCVCTCPIRKEMYLKYGF